MSDLATLAPSVFPLLLTAGGLPTLILLFGMFISRVPEDRREWLANSDYALTLEDAEELNAEKAGRRASYVERSMKRSRKRSRKRSSEQPSPGYPGQPTNQLPSPTIDGQPTNPTSPRGGVPEYTPSGKRRKPKKKQGSARIPGTILVAFLAGLGVWVLFLSWTPDQIGLPKGGPYASWQVVACAVAAAAVELVLIRRARDPVPAAFAATLGFVWGFAIAWSFWAASSDETGLWGVGLIFLMFGSTVGLLAVGLIFAATRDNGVYVDHKPMRGGGSSFSSSMDSLD